MHLQPARQFPLCPLFRAPLFILGEFLDSPGLPSSSFLQKIKHAVPGFTIPLSHHLCKSQLSQLPPPLLEAQSGFVREDTSGPSLAPLYSGPFLVLERQDKFFRLQLGNHSDVVSVDRIKPAFSDIPISAVSPPLSGRPDLCPPAPVLHPSTSSSLSSTAVSAPVLPIRSVCFQQPPSSPVKQNPQRAVRDRRLCSALSPLFLLGGVLWQIEDNMVYRLFLWA